MDIELVAITPNPEAVIERAARVCYQSGDRTCEGSAAEMIPRLVAMGHLSPLEHAYASFMIRGCSRAMSHQLVRHRLMAVCQKSQRYVTEQAFEYVTPPALDAAQVAEFDADMAAMGDTYAKWKARGVRNEDARFVLPNACATELMISANFREFRHIFAVRCSRHAQWEIRAACERMREMLREEAPSAFGDLV